MTNSVRFIHTADLHLDSPLRSLASRNSALRDLLEDASRTMLRRLVDTALEESVDALLIAGDLFDGELRDVRTAKLLERELRRLDSAEIPVFIIWGNHDAEARLVDILNLPDNVQTFNGKGGRATFAEDQAVVHGVSFANKKAPNSLLGKFGPPTPGTFNIGMLHTSLTGSEGHNNYAPCSVQELIDMGYDYWALGHIHTRKVHSDNPAIVMPGNPLGRHINEDGKRSISLVTLEQGKDAVIREIDIAPASFEKVRVPLTDEESLSDILDAIKSKIETTKAHVDAELLIVRIVLEGNSPLYRLLNREQESVLIDSRMEYEHRDDIWIDSLDVKGISTVDSASEHALATEGDNLLLGALTQTIDQQLLNSLELKETVQADLDKLARALPGELNTLFDDGTTESQSANVEQVLRDGATWIMHQLEIVDTPDSERNES